MAADVVRKKRHRGPNFGAKEQDLLSNLVLRYWSVLDTKRTDAVACREKEMCWRRMEHEFNASSEIKRTWVQLRTAFDNLKKRAKRQAALDETAQQSGGSTKQVDTVSAKILALLGKAAAPMPNAFDDDDDDQQGEEGIQMLPVYPDDDPNIILPHVEVAGSGHYESEAEESNMIHPSPLVTMVTPPTPEEGGEAPGSAESAHLDTEVTARVMMEERPESPSPKRDRSSKAAQKRRREAMNGITQLVKVRSRYYEAKMKQDQEVHEARIKEHNLHMAVMAAKLAYYSQNKKS